MNFWNIKFFFSKGCFEKKSDNKPKTGRIFCKAWFWGRLMSRICKEFPKPKYLKKKNNPQKLDGYFWWVFHARKKKKSEKWAIANMFNIIKLCGTGNSYPFMSPWLALIKETVKIQVSEDEANRTLWCWLKQNCFTYFGKNFGKLIWHKINTGPSHHISIYSSKRNKNDVHTKNCTYTLIVALLMIEKNSWK